MRHRILVLSMVAGLWGCTGASERLEIPAISHTVLRDDVSQSPGKTQVTQNLLVNSGITEAELRTLLHARYEEATRRTGFKFHEHPTVVAIYAYSSREHAESGMGQWVGMLSKTPGDTDARISIHDSVGQASADEDRFGLSEAQRRDIYKQIVRAEDRAQADAEQKYPTEYAEQVKLASELGKANRETLARKLKLTSAQLKEIGAEGLKENWPLPRR